MRKYLSIISMAWQRNLTFRTTIVAYRIGEILELLILILMWSAIFAKISTIGGYTKIEMITYIMIGNLSSLITRSFLSTIVARDIREGTLSLFITRPLTYFKYMLAREAGRIVLPSGLSILTQSILLIIFHRHILINTNLSVLGLIAVMLLLAFVTELMLSFLIGMINFWTDDIEGIHDTVQRLKRFFAGSYFPISLLPASYIKASFLLPFAYTFFIPAQLYLGKIGTSLVLKGLLVQMAWILVIYVSIKIVWSLGIRKYEGVGI